MLEVMQKVARISRAHSFKMALALGAVLGVGSIAAAADQTFPGTNGRISYDSGNPPTTWVNFVDPATKNTMSYGAGVRSATYSPAGNRVAFYNETDRRLYVSNTDLTNRVAVTPATPAGVYVSFIRWAPNGTKLLYIRTVPGTTIQEVWAINNVTTSTAPLKLSGANETCSIPDWANDSTWVTYTAQGTTAPLTDSEVYIQRADGSQRTALTNNNVNEYNPRWAPNGSGIAFSTGTVAHQLKAYLLVTANILGTWTGVGNPVAISASTGDFYVLAWSPDSTKIVAMNGNRMMVLRAPGFMTGWTELNTGVNIISNPIWSPDSTKLAYKAMEVGGLRIMNHDATNQVVVQAGTVGEINSWQRLP